MTPSRRFAAPLVVLALFGLAISAVSVANHYEISDADYCSFSDTFNCDLVNRSIYSLVFDVPVAIVGVAGYLLLGVLALLRHKAASVLLFLASLGAFGFSLYLTYIEARVLFVWCILCLGSLGIITLITALAGLRLFSHASEKRATGAAAR